MGKEIPTPRSVRKENTDRSKREIEQPQSRVPIAHRLGVGPNSNGRRAPRKYLDAASRAPRQRRRRNIDGNRRSTQHPASIDLGRMDLALPETEEDRRQLLNLRLGVAHAISTRVDFARFAQVDIRNSIISLNRYRIDYTLGVRYSEKSIRDYAAEDLRLDLEIDSTHSKMILGLLD